MHTYFRLEHEFRSQALLSHAVGISEVLLKGKSFERAFAELEKQGMRGDTVIGSLPYRVKHLTIQLIRYMHIDIFK